jgi:antibiotic biosynthesis monooxygenase (ABM) superfamily enzyme
MALTVLLGLYPTVMLLTFLPGLSAQQLGLAYAMLIGNAISVCILQWAVMPALNVLVAPWLKADSDKQKALLIGGVIGILAALGGMAILFHRITG